MACKKVKKLRIAVVHMIQILSAACVLDIFATDEKVDEIVDTIMDSAKDWRYR